MKKAEAMQRLNECCRLQRKSRWTIKAYSEWLERYIDFLATCRAETIEEKMGQFLTRIITNPRLFNYLIMGLYLLNATRWAYERKWHDVCYWLSALAITATVTFGYKH